MLQDILGVGEVCVLPVGNVVVRHGGNAVDGHLLTRDGIRGVESDGLGVHVAVVESTNHALGALVTTDSLPVCTRYGLWDGSILFGLDGGRMVPPSLLHDRLGTHLATNSESGLTKLSDISKLIIVRCLLGGE